MKNSTKKHVKDVAKIAAGAYIGSKLARAQRPPAEYEDSWMAVVEENYNDFVYEKRWSPSTARCICGLAAIATMITFMILLAEAPIAGIIVGFILGSIVYFTFPTLFMIIVGIAIVAAVLGGLYLIGVTLNWLAFG